MPQQASQHTQSGLSDKSTTLLSYLNDQVSANSGEVYMKSKFISDDIDLSSKEIGALMHQLKNANTQLSIEEWSYTSATTWRITN